MSMDIDAIRAQFLRTIPAQPEELQKLAQVGDEAQTELLRTIDMLELVIHALGDFEEDVEEIVHQRIVQIAGAAEGIICLVKGVCKKLGPVVTCDEKERPS